MIKFTDLAAKIAEKHFMKSQEVVSFLTLMGDVLIKCLQEKKQVKVKGLGTFKVTTMNARESVDVNTGERILIESREKISFVPDASLRDWVNSPFAQFDTVVVNEGVDLDKLNEIEELPPVVEMEEPEVKEEPAVEPEESTIELEESTVESEETETEMEAEAEVEVETEAEVEEQPAAETEEVEVEEAVTPMDEEDGSRGKIDFADNLESEEKMESAVEIVSEEEILPDSEEFVESEMETEDETETEIETETEVEPETEIETETETETEETILPEVETETEFENPGEVEPVKVDAEVVVEPEPAVQPEIVPLMEPQAKFQTESQVESQVESQAEPQAEPQADASATMTPPLPYKDPKMHPDYLLERIKKKNMRISLLTTIILALLALMLGGSYYLYHEIKDRDARIANLVGELQGYTQHRVVNNPDSVEMQKEEWASKDAEAKKAHLDEVREAAARRFHEHERRVEEEMSKITTIPNSAYEHAVKTTKTEPETEPASVEAELTRKREAAPKQAETANKQTQKDSDLSVYNNDPRVRSGSYVIIGVGQTITVRDGQSFTGISKAYLGPGMEKYLEVVNGGIKSVKPGQKLRLPILRKKQAND